jgi:hypothetical protein
MININNNKINRYTNKISINLSILIYNKSNMLAYIPINIITMYEQPTKLFIQ